MLSVPSASGHKANQRLNCMAAEQVRMRVPLCRPEQQALPRINPVQHLDGS